MRVAGGNVRMPAEQQVARAERGRGLLVCVVTVCGIDQMRTERNQCVVCHDGKRQHHLVNLGFAVAPHTEQAFLNGGEQGDHPLGVVLLRQIVARSVIQQVAQQKQAVGLFVGKAVQQHFAKMGGAVNVRCDHPFQKTYPLLSPA